MYVYGTNEDILNVKYANADGFVHFVSNVPSIAKITLKIQSAVGSKFCITNLWYGNSTEIAGRSIVEYPSIKFSYDVDHATRWNGYADRLFSDTPSAQSNCWRSQSGKQGTYVHVT
jgi:hypothetical protein